MLPHSGMVAPAAPRHRACRLPRHRRNRRLPRNQRCRRRRATHINRFKSLKSMTSLYWRHIRLDDVMLVPGLQTPSKSVHKQASSSPLKHWRQEFHSYRSEDALARKKYWGSSTNNIEKYVINIGCHPVRCTGFHSRHMWLFRLRYTD